MSKTYAEQQLARAKQYRAEGNEPAAIDAANRVISNLLDLPMEDVEGDYTDADEAIAAAESDVMSDLIDRCY